MSDINIKKIIANEYSYNIIRILRSGPLKKETIGKYLKTIANFNIKNLTKILKSLEDNKIITSFLMVKDEIYYLLIKDFYIIRIPPQSVFRYIQKKKSDIPLYIRERYLNNVKRFFSSYISSNRKLIEDFERELINIIINSQMSNLIKFLRNNPFKLKFFEKKHPDFKNAKNLLKRYDIIEIIEEWVFLKTDLSFKFFFPEYLIKNITEKLKDKKINKILALKSLYQLKRSYLKSEKPEMFDNLQSRIKNKVELVKSLEEKGEKPIGKAKELKKLFKDIGDYDNRILWEKKILEWEKKD
ncbi:MAG: hypothetical protein ACTSQJ_14900 [Promethearchaeota archaeon]